MHIRLNWRHIFSLPNKTDQHMVVSLQHPEYMLIESRVLLKCQKRTHVRCASCNMAITFTSDDLLLSSKPHNSPLFMIGFIKEQKFDCFLVDGGSTVNIIPKSTIHELGIIIKELSRCRTMIQGFNLKGQCAIGMIHSKLMMVDLSMSYRLPCN